MQLFESYLLWMTLETLCRVVFSLGDVFSYSVKPWLLFCVVLYVLQQDGDY